MFSQCNMDRAMDEMVVRSMAKWPDVPDVYGWLSLDRRGNWLIRSTSATPSFERIGNPRTVRSACSWRSLIRRSSRGSITAH